jgi:hypothetical protein
VALFPQAKLVIIPRGFDPLSVSRYNLCMRFADVLIAITLATAALAQSAPKLAPESDAKSVAVPITLDHNRVVINVDLRLPDGSAQQVRAWVDNGDPDLWMSRNVATSLGLTITCNGQVCGAAWPPGVAPIQITIGGLRVALSSTTGIRVPGLVPAVSASAIAPGMSAGIKISSTVLQNYDVLINFPDRQFTIGRPGSLKFNGVTAKALVNPQNGLVQISSQVGNKKYNLALDLGASISFLSDELFGKLATTHADWPQMTGAVGPANVWGLNDETKWKLMRVDRVQYGPLFLTDVPAAEFPVDSFVSFEKRAGVPTAGLLGAEALLNYRVGIDYAHSTVYFDIGRLFKFPDFDVIGLILRPEDDGRFTILGIADYGGKPSVPSGQDGVQASDCLLAVDGIPVTGSTLGQVWSMLGGSPGNERTLTVERGGKQFNVVAKVQHFLADAPDKDESKKKPRKN